MKTLRVQNGACISYNGRTTFGQREFVTHKCRIEEDGSINKYWGHYYRGYEGLQKAIKDFEDRAGITAQKEVDEMLVDQVYEEL